MGKEKKTTGNKRGHNASPKGFVSSPPAKPTPPTAIPTQQAVKVVTKVSNKSPETMYDQLRLLSGEQLDWDQARDDYFFRIQDLWDSLNNNMEPNAETLSYLEEYARAIVVTELGKQILRAGYVNLNTSGKPFVSNSMAVLYKVLFEELVSSATKEIEANCTSQEAGVLCNECKEKMKTVETETIIRGHKPYYDLGEMEYKNEISGYNELYCSLCCSSYPCRVVKENLVKLDSEFSNKIENQMINLAREEGYVNWHEHDAPENREVIITSLKEYGLNPEDINESITSIQMKQAVTLLEDVKKEQRKYEFYIESDGDPADYDSNSSLSERQDRAQAIAQEAFGLLGFNTQQRYDKASDYITHLIHD